MGVLDPTSLTSRVTQRQRDGRNGNLGKLLQTLTTAHCKTGARLHQFLQWVPEPPERAGSDQKMACGCIPILGINRPATGSCARSTHFPHRLAKMPHFWHLSSRLLEAPGSRQIKNLNCGSCCSFWQALDKEHLSYSLLYLQKGMKSLPCH